VHMLKIQVLWDVVPCWCLNIYRLSRRFFWFSFMAQYSLVSLGLLTVKASRSHSDKPHSIELLWTNDQHDAESSTWQHTTLTTAKCHALAGFESTIPASERPQTYALDRAATGTGKQV
jgi:hypothetical protein